ncbi:hypothetical protein GJU40_16250 [Bacillus lacus]|uniref:Uncharacterized protein n=1 Tax=Metabacillus lacus TaxID=1983721 RepID=A0A7X2J330_9BACI|nr:hypothetical protein [Metabacillus lacus]MRX73693.1 hypothetical protein [Metabacillus lacus]
MKKNLLIVVLSFILLIVFGSIFFKEGNQVLALTSIVKLELSNSDYEQVFETNKFNSYVSKYTGDSQYVVTKKFMKEKGWVFKEQMGSGLVFEKNEKTTIVGIRGSSKNYIQWDISKEVLD